MSAAIILPTRLAPRTIKSLQCAGYFVYPTRGKRRVLTVVHGRVPTLSNVVALRPSAVEEIFRFANRPQ